MKYRPFAHHEDRFTLVDNFAFDQIMPNVSGNAWKVICFIIRKTRGWVDPDTGQRKATDDLAYSQIMKGTGIGSRSTVSRALDELVKPGYIIAKGSPGTTTTYGLNTEYEVEATPAQHQSKTDTSTETVPPTSTETVPPPVQKLDTQKKGKKQLKKNGVVVDSTQSTPQPNGATSRDNTAADTFTENESQILQAIRTINQQLPEGDRFSNETELARIMAERGESVVTMRSTWKQCAANARNRNGAFLMWMRDATPPPRPAHKPTEQATTMEKIDPVTGEVLNWSFGGGWNGTGRFVEVAS